MQYGYSIKLQDLMSGPMMKIARTSQTVFSKISQQHQKLKEHNRTAGSSIDNLRQRLEQLQNSRNRSTNLGFIRFMNIEARKTERQLRKLENLPPRSFTDRLRNAGSEMKTLLGLTSGVAIAMGAFRGAKAIFNAGLQAEQTNIKFEVLLGSAGKAKAMLDQLNTYANATPYTNDGIRRNAELLLAFGTAHEKVQPTIAMLGDVSLGNQKKMDSLTLAYAQSMTAGRLMGQDLLQMINQGFNPLQIISEKTGLSMSNLRKKMEQGAISSDMVSEAFKIATSEGGKFYQMSSKMSQTAGGRISTLVGKLREVGKVAGLKLLNWTKPIIEFAITAVDYIPVVVEQFRSLGGWIETNSFYLGLFGIAVLALNAPLILSKLSLLAFTIQFKAYVLWTKIAAAAQWLWNAALTANPIGLVIAGIVALIAIVIACWNKFEGFRGTIMGAWETLKLFGTIIKDYVINRFRDLLSGIVGIGKALMHFFDGDWKKAWEVGKKAAGDLTGINAKVKAFEQAKGVGDAWRTGYQKGVGADPIKIPKLLSFGKGNKKGAVDPLATEGTPGTLTGNDDPDKIFNGISQINNGGARQTHITVNLQKLQDKTEIHTTNLEEAVDETEDKLMQMLLRVLNSANQLQTN